MAIENAVSWHCLKRLLSYSPATGDFVWTEEAAQRRGRTRAGEVAGLIAYGGYRRISVNGTTYAAHRLAWFYMTGEWPADEIDHVNGDRADNRFANLRQANRVQNIANTRVRKDSVSGLKGVCYRKDRNSWRARMKIDGREISLGTFKTEDEAFAAYAAAAVARYGQFVPQADRVAAI